MNVRIGAAGLLGFAVIIGGCAGGPAPEAIVPQPVAEEDLPAWILALPEGEPPRDNDQTNEAELALFRASGEDDPVVAQPFWQEALEAAQAGIQMDPTNSLSYHQAGRAYLGLGDLREADEMFSQAEEIYPRSVVDSDLYRETEWVEAFNEAVGFMPDNVDSAIAALERAHTIYRGRPDAMIQLGSLYQQSDRPEDALDMFEQAIEVIESPRGQAEEDPAVIAAYQESLALSRFNRAQLLFDLERFSESAEEFQALVNDNPDDLMAYGNLGAALGAAGDVAGASRVYDELLGRPGLGLSDLNLIAVGAYNADLFLQAAQAFGGAHEILPQNRDYIFNQAQSLYLAEEEHEELLAVATRLIELDTHNRNARRFLAQALIRLEREQEAVDVLEEMEALPFEISGLQLARAAGGFTLPGILTNWNSDPDSTVSIRFQFFDSGGMQVEMQDVSYPLGAVEEGLQFQVDVLTEAEVAGYSYEVLN